MTNYKAVQGTDTNNQLVWFVTFADGPRIGTRVSLTGYKNEESAKRRIRDLKRKDAEAITTVPAATPSQPDAMKLAASSAYGKSNIMPGEKMKTAFINAVAERNARKIGVYPAIGKREYRKRWNYA